MASLPPIPLAKLKFLKSKFIILFFFYEALRIIEFIGIDNRIARCQELYRRDSERAGSYCLVSPGFQLENLKNFCMWRVVTMKRVWMYLVSLSCVYLTTIK